MFPPFSIGLLHLAPPAACSGRAGAGAAEAEEGGDGMRRNRGGGEKGEGGKAAVVDSSLIQDAIQSD